MIRVSDFLNTIGVNTRLAYTDGDYRSAANVLSALNWLGIDHVRDFGVWNKWVGQSSYGLLADAGIKFDMVLQTNRSPDDFIQQVAAFDQNHPGVVFAIEGPNEINLTNLSYGGVTGSAAGQAVVNRMVELTNASPVLDDARLFDLTGARVTDGAEFDNVHLYSHNGDEPLTMISNSVATQAQREPAKPMVITELGYHTGVGNPTWEGVDESTQAKLTLNALLDAEKLGVSQTYLFQLFDAYADASGTGIDSNMGLFDYGYEPKKAAVALHNLTTILADHGAAASTFSAKDLPYTVSNMPTAGDSLVFEKSNGTYDIVLWAEPDIWDQANDAPIAVAPTQSHVDFAGTHYDVRIFDPLISDRPVAQFSNVTSVDVAVSDHPLIVELTPPGSTKEDLSAAASSLHFSLWGTSSANSIDGTSYDDTIKGLGGNDTLNGGSGNDQLYGGGGNDLLNGGAGDDLLGGGGGRDILSGGGGTDVFKFASADSRGATLGAADLILDWTADDRIDLPVKGSDTNYFESTAVDFAEAAKIANAQLVNGMKLCSIAVGGDVFVFGEYSATHSGYDAAILLQHTQLSDISWSNIV
jgi:hypothetical protein